MAEGFTLADAYIQIIPSAKGIRGSITKEIGGEAEEAGTSAGTSMGASLGSALKKAVVALGIGKIVKDALDAGGALQQSFGGLDTIYEDASAAAKKYAQEAAAAGISANDYAEQAVSFGAALKQAFGNDVTKAADAANTAIMDMADNSAKMGTDISSIQNAYQGFAKQNYTMLDNLKLGYGGTKAEMERLLADAEKLSGVEYNIDNLGDVYDAIHVIQGELGLTGVAAQEASTTFTGSFGAMKAAAENLLANLTLGEDIKPALDVLGQTVESFLMNNLVPMITNLLNSLPDLLSGLSDILTGILDEAANNAEGIVKFGLDLIQNLAKSIIDNAPKLVIAAGKLVVELGKALYNELGNMLKSITPEMAEGGIETIRSLIDGFLKGLPDVINSATEILGSFLDTFLQHLPEILEMGVDLVLNIVQGILKNLPEIIAATIKMLSTLVTTIIKHFPEILQKGIEIIGKIRAGIIQAIPDIVRGIGEVIKGMLDYWKSVYKTWFSVGGDIIKGIVEGIKNAAESVWNAIRDVCSKALQAAKDFFKIGSPSKLMSDQIGQWIPAGIASGIEDNVATVKAAMDELSGIALNEASVGLNASVVSNVASSQAVSGKAAASGSDDIATAVFNALQGMYIYMDSRAVGQLVAEPVNDTLGKNAIRRV